MQQGHKIEQGKHVAEVLLEAILDANTIPFIAVFHLPEASSG